jgi:putative CocE/NonD family hydrolase
VWCNGKVGMFGGSYTGFVQWAAMKKLHPALKTIVPQVPVMPGFDTPMENNIPLTGILNWSNDNIYKATPLSQNLLPDWYTKGSSYRTLDDFSQRHNDIFQKMLLHPDYDSYWSSMVPSPEEYSRINIPVLVTTGYYDGSQISAMEYMRLYFKYNKNPDLYLVIGPYDHWGGQRKAAPELMKYKTDSVANVSMREVAYEWLDFVLKGKKKPSILQDRINFEVIGANEWKHVPELKNINSDTLTFYLRPAEKENTGPVLSSTKQSGKYLSLSTNLADRSDSAQNNYFTPFIINEELNAGNGIVFKTAPFTESIIVNGGMTGKLFASINKKDMDVSIAFYEEMPDGKYFYLTRYLGRASYSEDNSTRKLFIPGEKKEININPCRMVSRKFNKGSRLVIVLNVNKHPFDEINYGSGKNVHDETIEDAGEALTIKWYSESFIRVPVLKK